MRYAILSDIHGNSRAMEAVLADASSRGVDAYIHGGDYFGDFPHFNEVIDTIRQTPNAYVIAGNKEGYLVDMDQEKSQMWSFNQFNGLYWSYENLRKDNLNYLLSLPMEITIQDPSGHEIRIIHDINKLFPHSNFKLFSSSRFALAMESNVFDQQTFLQHFEEKIQEDKNLVKSILARPESIIVCGHSHIQWHVAIGDKLIINSGSIGVPLDFRTTAAYTILEVDESGGKAYEYRVSYDVEEMIETAKNSEMYPVAKDWSEIIFTEMRSGKEEVAFFLKHAKEIGKNHGDESWPLPNHIWQKAVKSWNRG